MQNVKNVVTMSLDRYTQLVTDKYIAQEELRYERKKNTHLNDMKNFLMEQLLDDYRITCGHYALEELTDIAGYSFAFKNPLKLLKLGIEIDEMIEFIKYKYEQFHKEDKQEEQDNE